MASGSELEPKDSRNVTGTARTPDGRWSGDAPEAGHGGELEPNDSRNVTGAAVTDDGRWTGAAVRPEEGPQVPEAKS
jgi:hypothetical protein